MAEKEQYIGKSLIKGSPKGPLKFKIGPKAVKPENLADDCFDTDKIPDGAITTEKIAKGAVTLEKISSDISSSLLALVIKDVSIIWDKIAEITGEQLQDLTFSVSPKYFISEDGIPVHISASSVGNNAMFDYITFYINGAVVAEAMGTDILEYDTAITDTSEIKYKASIMGTEYSGAEVVVHYNSYWIGAGNVYTDVMDIGHLIPITEGMRSVQDINFHEGERLFIILGSSLRDQFYRADLNGMEIPFNETVVTIEGKQYNILSSENQFTSGMHNIDING